MKESNLFSLFFLFSLRSLAPNKYSYVPMDTSLRIAPYPPRRTTRMPPATQPARPRWPWAMLATAITAPTTITTTTTAAAVVSAILTTTIAAITIILAIQQTASQIAPAMDFAWPPWRTAMNSSCPLPRHRLQGSLLQRPLRRYVEEKGKEKGDRVCCLSGVWELAPWNG